MRTRVLVPLVLATLTACGGQKSGTAQSAASASPAPLHACETREMTLDNVDLMLQANIDGTPSSITIVHAADRDAQDKAVEEARKLFGEPHADTRTMTHQSKWGIVEITDPCGRPVSAPSATPLPA